MNALRSTVGHLQPSSQGKTPHPHINRVEQLEEDPYWFNNYSSFVSDLDRPSTAPPATGLAEVLPPPHRSAKRFEIKPRRLTPFPQTPQFRTEDLHSKITTTTPITPKTNTSDSGNDQIISIYPTEILSPTLSDPSERSGDGESPLKAVRFAHINTYHSTASPRTASSPRTVNISPSNLYNLAEEPPHTASTHKRAQSDPKAGRGNLRGAGDQRRISDPIPPYFGLPSKDLPLRGDIPVKMSSRSAANGKRPERERKDGMRSRGYDRDGGREYGPSNIHRPIRPAPKDLETIARLESSLILQTFTCADAWALGSALRERLIQLEKPAVINITLSSGQVLFHCCTKSGSTLDHSMWVERKRNSVIRWGVSTWYLTQKYGGDETLFAFKNQLGENEKERFAIGGGGLPIRVQGVEGVVAVVVVCGLKGEENHEVIVETIQDHWY